MQSHGKSRATGSWVWNLSRAFFVRHDVRALRVSPEVRSRYPFRTTPSISSTLSEFYIISRALRRRRRPSRRYRVLKPGGCFFVHETNPQNPLFRFYMGYVFPILKSIDKGTEIWLEPRKWQSRIELKLDDVKYFTFLPDFLPAWLLRPFLALERRLETSRLGHLSVHYMAIFRKLPKSEMTPPQLSGKPLLRIWSRSLRRNRSAAFSVHRSQPERSKTMFCLTTNRFVGHRVWSAPPTQWQLTLIMQRIDVRRYALTTPGSLTIFNLVVRQY